MSQYDRWFASLSASIAAPSPLREKPEPTKRNSESRGWQPSSARAAPRSSVRSLGLKCARSTPL